MDLKKDYRYYVVHILKPPYSDIDQYICIPCSWIQLRGMLKKVVFVKFPVENLSITKKRVKDGEDSSDDWAIYGAQVKYGTDSYNEAEKYIARLKEKLIKKPNGSEAVNNGDTLSKLSKNLQRSKRNQSNRSVNKPQLSEAPSNYSKEPVSESLAGISTEIETLKIQTNRVETFNTANEVIKQTDASSESLYGEQLLSNTEQYLHKNTGKQKNNDKKLNNVDSIENDNGPKGIAGNETPANHDGPQLANESLDATIISEPISDTGNPGQVNFEEGISLLLDHMRDGYFQCCKSLEKLMDNINNQYYCGSYTPFNPTIKDAVAPVVEENEHEEEKNEKQKQVLKRTQTKIGIIKRREIERNEQEIDNSADNDDGDDDYKDDDDDDDDDDDYVKRKRFQSRTLTLPSEYDQNDSKWTLRYREYAPGLVELIEHTGVYINAVKLMNCKRLAKNSKTLARLLLVEIFTESALCTCSLTGVRAKAFDIDGTHVRPGLDENARTVLLTYVEQYAQASKWPKTDNQSILNSIRNKMQEIRVKCNK